MLAAVLLLALPALALAPAWMEGRLLGPGDGAALHYPLRFLTWAAWRRGELPGWNPTVFLGTPLLAAYRPGALYPLMLPLALLPSFPAFQVLVLSSLGLAGLLTFLYLRRLGAGSLGAYVGGLAFALGPYLVGHLDDTPTVVAAPTLPLLLLGAESLLRRRDRRGAAALAACLALVLLAGSPTAARAGIALLLGRLLAAWLGPEKAPPLRLTVAAMLGGTALAAPQLVPALLAARDAGGGGSGLVHALAAGVPGATGLALRYLSHTPAPQLAVAALPLLLTHPAVRVLGAGMALALFLQWGRGPLSAPGALPLIFDFTLAVLGGLSLSTQWQARHNALGRHLRAHLLAACVLGAVGLSVAAAAAGPLPQTLAGAVGVLALSLILYLALADSADPVYASVFLLPLTAAFVLQPHGRGLTEAAPTEAALREPSGTREALERAMGGLRAERTLTLVREFPPDESAVELAYGDLAALVGRVSANGYDPLSSRATRTLLGGMSAGGTLPETFFATDPARVDAWGARLVQVPVGVLVGKVAEGWGERVDLRVDRPRQVPLPITAATEVRLVSALSGAERLPQGRLVGTVEVRLATQRTFCFPLRAGVETAEWAFDRPDVAAVVPHARPEVVESWPEAGFAGHRYAARLPLPGRYYVDAVRLLPEPGAGMLTVFRLALFDAATSRLTPASTAAAFVSEPARFREIAATPAVRLFDLPRSPGLAFVVPRLRALPDPAAVEAALAAPTRQGIDLTREALWSGPGAPPALGEGAAGGRAQVARRPGGGLDVRALGPGLLVVAEAADPGWSARLDGLPVPLLRVNGGEMGIVLPAGVHRAELSYFPRGWAGALAACVLGALLAAGGALRPGPPAD